MDQAHKIARLQAIEEHIHARDADAAMMREIEALHADPDPATRCYVCRLLGLDAFYRKDFARSEASYEEALDHDPADLNALEGIVHSATLGRGKEAGIKAFDRLETTLSIRRIGLALSRFRFAGALYQCGAYAAAKAQIDRLRDIYAEMRVTDHHFLFDASMPSFDEFLYATGLVLAKALSPADEAAWWQDLSARVDEGGRERIAARARGE